MSTYVDPASHLWDPTMAKALADNWVKNNSLALSKYPVSADLLHVTGLWSLCPGGGVACELDTTAREFAFVAPPFATRLWIEFWIAGSGDVTAAASSGASGTVTATGGDATSETGKAYAARYVTADALTVTDGDVCRLVKANLSRASNVKCYGFSAIWGRLTLTL